MRRFVQAGYMRQLRHSQCRGSGSGSTMHACEHSRARVRVALSRSFSAASVAPPKVDGDDDEVLDVEVFGIDDVPPPHSYAGIGGVGGIGGGHSFDGVVVEHPSLPDRRLVWGKYAALAGASALVSKGGTQVLVTVVSEKPRPGQPEKTFLPLTVEYKEKMYGVGRVPQTFMRRELFTKNHEILAARAIDRSVRPLFRKDYARDTQIICTVLSFDGTTDTVSLALNGVSACLHARSADFGWDAGYGPVAAVRVGIDPNSTEPGDFVLDPPPATHRGLDLNALVVMRENGRVVMLEAGGREVPEETFLRAIQFARDHRGPQFELQHALRKAVGEDDAEVAAHSAVPRRWSFSQQHTPVNDAADATPVNSSSVDELLAPVYAQIYDDAVAMCREPNRTKKQRAVSQTNFWAEAQDRVKTARESLASEGTMEAQIGDGSPSDAIHAVLKKAIRDVAKGLHGEPVRPDGRRLDEVRPLESELAILPMAHGSALFGRGDTQVICSATLGPADDLQQPEKDSLVDIAEPQPAILHYEFLPYSTNHTGRTQLGFNRRMIGHSALAERSILNVLPRDSPPETALRLTSEVTSSDGSSSMATVCGTSLAAAHAQIPIASQIAGIAIGAYIEPDPEAGDKSSSSDDSMPSEQAAEPSSNTTGGFFGAVQSLLGFASSTVSKQGEDSTYPEDKQEFVLLTDILGMEDHFGDMDFKITGSNNGLTACQLDVKAPGGIGMKLIAGALDKARSGRSHILEHMEQSLREMPAVDPGSRPATGSLQLPPGDMDARRKFIGENGKNIRRVEAETRSRITIDQSNKVIVFSQNPAQLQFAVERISSEMGLSDQ